MTTAPAGAHVAAALIIVLLLFGVVAAVTLDTDGDDDGGERAATTTTEPMTAQAPTMPPERATTSPTPTTSTTSTPSSSTTAPRPTTTTSMSTSATTTATTAAAPGSADLLISLFGSGSSPAATTYTAFVHNLGPGDSGSVTVTVDAPGVVVLTPVGSSGGSCSGGGTSRLLCAVGPVGAGGRAVGFLAEMEGQCPGDLLATATSTTADPVSANNSRSAPGPGCSSDPNPK
ncbi:MAG: hypothetical protein ACRD0G_16870 [Acidimicrobiales bacterium]